jgi:GT2 family glycosyltransferase
VGTAAVVVSWEGGATTARCVASLRAQDRPPSEIVVVDNASSEVERERLRRDLGAVPGVRLLLLDENRQFAGGLNAGARAAFAAGAERVLLLNNDTVLAPDALGRLEDAVSGARGPGIAAPVLVDMNEAGRVISAGERVLLPLLCVPRTLLRYRARGDAPYAVSGIMGCALLVTRECFEAVGGFAEEIQVYYEDVDFCLAARAGGFGAVLVPRAVVRHDGMRGFAAGLTPWAAFLKARNPWLVVRRHGTALTWLTFVPTYAALVLASAAIWAVRGRLDVVRALARGVGAGIAAATGGRAVPVGPPRGRA